ncbi:hypothetical protein [Pontibacter arcticus]|uniref:Uncharacterized protein n=1 Tax=Pontibacter arcticus TaxID=2080288 RepID=A0A364RCZ1_9BACT|nr:hypothetical protein [Pontibacter arcticus]RAU82201.1 hypothetical protein DP923_10405 [Pontibacter arcticus]
MRKITAFASVLSLLTLFSCNEGDDVINPGNPSEQKADTLQGVITSDLALKQDQTYYLKGQVYVKNNAVLTIPAGVTVTAGSSKDKQLGALVITQGAKLFVNGTSERPVVFTSAAATKAPGDWAGIFVLGKAPTNLGQQANLPGLAVSADTKFGGDVATDNSGSISYLRVAYTGGLNPANEDEWAIDLASGLTLAGVGTGTKVSHVMVTNSKDDGFQFLGGTVNAKNLIAYNNGDDDFDFDRGYTGKLQFLISYRTKTTTHALRANAMESLNDFDALGPQPFTRPVISNMTIIGPQGAETTKTNLNQGVYIRKATRFAVRNSIIAEYPQGGLMVCMKTRPVLLKNEGSEFKYNLVHSDNAARAFTWDLNTEVVADPELEKFGLNETNQNKVISSFADFKLKSPYAQTPDFTVSSESVAATGANFSGNDYTSFFSPVAFRGAVGGENWAAASNWAVWK